MRSERVSNDLCGLERRWILDPTLVRMLFDLETWATERMAAEGIRWPGVWVISGHRPRPIQGDLTPGEAPATASRHIWCPSLAVDLRIGNAPASITDPTVWAFLGVRWEIIGGRWGGRFDPPDVNHFDIDPLIAN